MTHEELTQKFTEFCETKNIERKEVFVENAVKFVELLKQYYGNIKLSADSFPKNDTIYVHNNLDVQSTSGTYTLDEYLFNRINRNIEAFYHVISLKGKEIFKGYIKQNLDDSLGTYDYNFNLKNYKPHPFIVMNDTAILDHVLEFADNNYNSYDNISKNTLICEYELMPEYLALTEKNLTTEQKEDLVEKAFNKEYFRTIAHELWHCAKAAFFVDSKGKVETGKLSPSHASKNNYDNIQPLYDCIDEIIHEYQICAALNIKRQITFCVPDNRTFVIKKATFGTENCMYSDNVDVAELIELIMGKDELFFGTLINREDFVKSFNAWYADVICGNSLLMDFYKDYLCKEYGIHSNKPWNIISAVNYYLCDPDDPYLELEIKLLLQETLINCIIKNVQTINPKNKNSNTLNAQLEYVKSLPASVNNVLMTDEDENNYKTTNVLAYLKLEDLCLEKQNQIENCIKENYREETR